MTLDNNGVPYVSIKGYRVCKYDDITSDWVQVGDLVGDYTNGHFDVAFDNTNTPYIAFSHFQRGNKVTVMKLDSISDTYVNVGASGFSEESGYSYRLCIDQTTNMPYITYINNSYSLAVKKFVE